MIKDDWLSHAGEQNNTFKSRMNSTVSLISRAAQLDPEISRTAVFLQGSQRKTRIFQKFPQPQQQK